MAIGHIDELKSIELSGEGIKGASKKVLIHPENGWDNHVMRLFTLENEGFTPRHSHPWPHINYITSGQGTLFLEGELHEIKAGSYAYVPGNSLHQFMADRNSDLSFICIVPLEGDPNFLQGTSGYAR
ncbi:cupin domain-containing protein [Myxococcota bacterium]|nr:cupin domain-containing protein [Myxococcota bacterium]MBU1381618.1 cupin domain-containing protein [Myxococcota bacterium]MBU1496838.1 cupin domain-containing protein [Myxococcota bacterium]